MLCGCSSRMDAKSIKKCTAIDALNPKKCAVFPQMVKCINLSNTILRIFYLKMLRNWGVPNPLSLPNIFVGNKFAYFGGTLPPLWKKTRKIVFERFPNRRVGLPKRMNFRKNSKRPLTIPLIFGKLYCNFFVMDMVAFMQGGIGQIVSVNIS